MSEAQRSEESELSDLLAALGVTDEWRLENIKETAMFRCNVKKSRREHVRKVLDEAFSLLKSEAANGEVRGASRLAGEASSAEGATSTVVLERTQQEP